jgi:hypothetical protein
MSENNNQIEFQENEVNICIYGCGDPRHGCYVDCIDGSSWLTTEE